MTIKRNVEIERFDVVDDDDGYQTTIVVTQSITDADSMDGSHPGIRNLGKDYNTTEGYGVNVKGDDEFEVLDAAAQVRTTRRA